MEKERTHALEVGSQADASKDAQDQAEDRRVVLAIHSQDVLGLHVQILSAAPLYFGSLLFT